MFAAAEQLAGDLSARGLTVMYDDRKASPGVKFKDAELIGVPTIVTVGRGLADGLFEVKDRASGRAHGRGRRRGGRPPRGARAELTP